MSDVKTPPESAPESSVNADRNLLSRRAHRLARFVRSRRSAWNQWAFDPDPEIVAALDLDLYFEGESRRGGISRFFTLLTLATLIAGFGLYADSLAVVVAAMLVAPLMTPIMGLALALVSGHLHRQVISTALIAIATVVAVLIGWLIGEMLPSSGPIQKQLIVRTEPHLIDLSIAMASGAAGAYALVRREAAAALPGVSIAISLVPPLATTGMLLARDESHLAAGSFELYLLNLTSMVLVGSIVFAILGFLPVHNLRHVPLRIRAGLLMAVVAVIAVAIPVARVSTDVLHRAEEQNEVGMALSAWANARPGVDLMDYTLTSDKLTIDLTGASMPDDVETLREDLQAAVNSNVEIQVRFYEYTPIILTHGSD